jgi:hypothetical protein
VGEFGAARKKDGSAKGLRIPRQLLISFTREGRIIWDKLQKYGNIKYSE